MSKQLRLLLFFSLIMTTIIFPTHASADVAPPGQPPITNPEPGSETTNVRMMSETVLIDIQPEKNKKNLGLALITAKFTMRNLGTSIENLVVRFPISNNDGFYNFPELINFSVKVDSTQIQFRRVTYPEPTYPGEADIPWAEFDISFPVGKDVNIEIAYELPGTGYPPYTAFYYILETGAGWFGPIGSADIILRLPYPANEQNVPMDTDFYTGWSVTTPGGTFSGNEVRWHFDEFEPSPNGPFHNLDFTLVHPAYWQDILDARKAVDKNPTDGEAWGRLAMATKGVFLMNKGYRFDPAGEELYALSLEAYEKCLELLPQDAQWHAGFADLLANRAYWESWMKSITPEAIRSIQEIQIALQLAPNDPIVLDIADDISYNFSGSMVQINGIYEFPWLTQTPTPHPTTVPASLISGEYKSEMYTLDNQNKMQMVVNLHSDYSAIFEANFEDGQTIQTSGTWWYVSDNRYVIGVNASDNNQYFYLDFSLEDQGINVIKFPAIFSGPSYWELKRTMLETPTPIPSKTPISTAQPSTEPTQEANSPVNPICGSGLFVPFGLVGVLLIMSKINKREEIVHDRKR